MNYLNPTFTVGGPAKLDGITCERCVYGRGEHAEGCRATVVIERLNPKLKALYADEAFQREWKSCS
jgi:hypothetical protein